MTVVKVDLDAMKVTHNAAGGELSDTKETNPGAFVPINNDDDDYTAVPGGSNGADKDQSGSITGESDLLQIKLHKVDPSVTGSKYTLDIPDCVRVWKKSDRSERLKPRGDSDQTEFDANADTTLYVEGCTVGNGKIKINWTDGTHNLDDCDEVQVTVFDWSGPLNVPGYAIYEYKASGALSASKWLTANGGQIRTGANTSDVTILWNAAPVVGKAVYQVNTDYIWDMEVNVVQIKISSANNSAKYPGVLSQAAPGSTTLNSNPAGGGHAMTANFRVELVKGPTVGGSDRGVKFMEMGLVHHARFIKERAYYDDVLPKKKRVGGIEGYQGGSWLWDPADASTLPWTFQDADHYFRPPDDNPVQNRDFSTFDSPVNFVTDKIVTNGDTVDRNELRMEHRVYFAVKTTVPDVNGSSAVLTQRLVLNWRLVADGTWDEATGVWSYAGPGDGVDGDGAWSEVTNGDRVPEPAVNDIVNTLLSTVDLPWKESNQ